MYYNQQQYNNFILELENKGYRKFNKTHYKSEDSSYWKSFHVTSDQYNEKIIGYQIAFLVYDYNKYELIDGIRKQHPFGIQCEFLIGNNDNVDRLDLTISDNKITIEEFENYCETFYQKMYIDYYKVKP